ncbi:hypothetical protein ACFVZQ_26250, partial [Streptomyces sp. NPDC059538]
MQHGVGGGDAGRWQPGPGPSAPPQPPIPPAQGWPGSPPPQSPHQPPHQPHQQQQSSYPSQPVPAVPEPTGHIPLPPAVAGTGGAVLAVLLIGPAGAGKTTHARPRASTPPPAAAPVFLDDERQWGWDA